MTTKFYYFGDVDARHGGMFYSTDNRKYHYSEVVRITPCSDAGGPDNMFWIECLTVNVPYLQHTIDNMLCTCGMSADELAALSPVARFAAMVEMCIAHGSYDNDSSTLVQIGAKDEFWSGCDEFMPDVTLRGNASIRNYALKVAHKGGF